MEILNYWAAQLSGHSYVTMEHDRLWSQMKFCLTGFRKAISGKKIQTINRDLLQNVVNTLVHIHVPARTVNDTHASSFKHLPFKSNL